MCVCIGICMYVYAYIYTHVTNETPLTPVPTHNTYIHTYIHKYIQDMRLGSPQYQSIQTSDADLVQQSPSRNTSTLGLPGTLPVFLSSCAAMYAILGVRVSGSRDRSCGDAPWSPLLSSLPSFLWGWLVCMCVCVACAWLVLLVCAHVCVVVLRRELLVICCFFLAC